MIFRLSFIIVFSLVSLLSSMTYADNLRLEAAYGQSRDFWNTIEDLEGKRLSPQEIDQFLNNRFTDPQEGFASFYASYESQTIEALKPFFTEGYFGLGVDQLTGGEIRNRIMPELRGYDVYSAFVNFGFTRKVPENESGWGAQLGSVIGLGQQRLVNATAAEFYPEPPILESAAFYWGLDLDVKYHSHISQNIRSVSTLTLKPSLFHSNFSNSSYRYKITEDSVFLRWSYKGEWIASLNSPFLSEFEAGIQTLSGQQPLPIRFVPRTWDSIHDIELFPSVGSIVGLGTVIRIFSENRGFQLELLGGFYGGYLGSGAEILLGPVHLTGGTWGLERTSGYRISESRINYISLGYHHEI